MSKGKREVGGNEMKVREGGRKKDSRLINNVTNR